MLCAVRTVWSFGARGSPRARPVGVRAQTGSGSGEVGGEGNTCLLSDPESVLLARGWVCCLPEALNGEKREGEREGGMISVFFSTPSSFQGCGHRPGGSRCREGGSRAAGTVPTGTLGSGRPGFKSRCLLPGPPPNLHATGTAAPAGQASRAVRRSMSEGSKNCL